MTIGELIIDLQRINPNYDIKICIFEGSKMREAKDLSVVYTDRQEYSIIGDLSRMVDIDLNLLTTP
jgi:hypothetical protein